MKLKDLSSDSLMEKLAVAKLATSLPDLGISKYAPGFHHVLEVQPPQHIDKPLAHILLGLGCFWGAERKYWQQPGVVYTAVGYGGGHMVQPSYDDVCTGKTDHIELVWVVYDTSKTQLQDLLNVFWESHDPTQGMRQGNDIGSQYRSSIMVSSQAQLDVVQRSRLAYQENLNAHGFTAITTEVDLINNFYFAEEYHQQYLSKNPEGYCGLKGTGVCVL